MTSQPSVTITGTVIGPSLKIPTISDLTFSCSDPDVICQISGLTYSLTGQFSEQGLVTLNYGFTVTNPNLVTVSVTFSGGFTSSPPPPGPGGAASSGATSSGSSASGGSETVTVPSPMTINANASAVVSYGVTVNAIPGMNYIPNNTFTVTFALPT